MTNSRAFHHFRKRVILGAPLLAAGLLHGQTPPAISPLDGTTPSINTPGAPAESYRLSSFEHINLANGHLHISLPLAELAGRGDAKETMVLPIESHWRVQSVSFQYNCPTCQTGTAYLLINETWTADEPSWWNGVMAQRSVGDFCGQHAVDGNGYTQTWTNTLTRLTFVAPDGTEQEFRDKLTNGQKQGVSTGVNNALTGFDRGTVFPT